MAMVGVGLGLVAGVVDAALVVAAEVRVTVAAGADAVVDALGWPLPPEHPATASTAPITGAAHPRYRRRTDATSS
jgi:hypothetical protein